MTARGYLLPRGLLAAVGMVAVGLLPACNTILGIRAPRDPVADAGGGFDSINVQTPEIGDGAREGGDVGDGSQVRDVSEVGEAPPDADVLALVVTPSTLMLRESEQMGKTFTVALSRPSPTPITVSIETTDRTVAVAMPDTVTFSANSVEAQTVTVIPTHDDDVADNDTSIDLTAGGLVPVSVHVQVNDVDVQAIVPTPTEVTLTEGKTGQFSVQLARRPAGDTKVTLVSASPGKLGVAPSTLTFTSSDFGVPQKITLTASRDSDVVDDKVTITLGIAGGAADLQVPVTIVDRDVLNLDVSPAGVTVTEGDATPATAFVALTNPPAGKVTVDVSSSAKATVSPSTLTFTPENFNTAQSVSILAVPDDDTQDDTATVTLSSVGLQPRTVMVNIRDPDTQAIVVSPASLMVNEGDSATFNVRLRFNPKASVSVSVFPSNTSKIDVSPSTLIFDASSFGRNQMVTVKGVRDDDLVDDQARVTLTSSGANAVDVPVTVRDDDKQAIQLVYAAFPGDIAMDESPSTGNPKTISFGVRLAFRPTAAVTVAIASDSPKLAVTPASLTFTSDDFSVIKLVTATSVHDNDLITDRVGVTASSDGVPSATLHVQIVDIDVESFSVDPSSLNLDEPGPAQGSAGAMFNVGLTLPPESPIRVTVTSSDSARVAVLAGSDAFTLSNNTTPKAVMLSVQHDSDSMDNSVTLTIAAVDNVIPPRTVSVAVHDTDAMSFVIGGLPPSGELVVEELARTTPTSDTATFTVRLSADPVTTRSVVVVPSVAGVVAVTPDLLTFTGGADGTWQTPQTVTIKGMKDENIQDELLNVRISGPNTLGASDAFITVLQKDIDIQAILLSADAAGTIAPDSPIAVAEGGAGKKFYVRLEFQPPTGVTVNVSLPDSVAGSLALSPSTLTFSTSDYAIRKAVTVLAPEEEPFGTLNMDDETAVVTVTLPFQATAMVNVKAVDNDTDKQRILVIDPACSSSCPQISTASVSESKQRATSVTTRSLNVALAYPPRKVDGGKQDLVVTLGAALMALPYTFTFDSTNGVVNKSWNAPQTLTIAATPDADDVDPPSPINVIIAPNNAAFGGTSVAVVINDKDDFLKIDNTVNGDVSVTLASGSSRVFNVRLDRTFATASMVSVLSSDDTRAQIDASLLSISSAGSANLTVIAGSPGDADITLTSSIGGIPSRQIHVHVP